MKCYIKTPNDEIFRIGESFIGYYEQPQSGFEKKFYFRHQIYGRYDIIYGMNMLSNIKYSTYTYPYVCFYINRKVENTNKNGLIIGKLFKN